ncbi:MAG: rhodanese-like domain-containing protein [Anaerolineales bacterium]|jgi:3-mercaptopyruvate sulfurtransferase SseA
MLLVIAGIWWVSTSSAPAALPTATLAVQQPTEESEIPFPTVTRADIGDVKADLDAGAAIVVDVRGLQYYQEAHIPGAISMPTDDLEAEYQSLPQDQMIYLYCT